MSFSGKRYLVVEDSGGDFDFQTEEEISLYDLIYNLTGVSVSSIANLSYGDIRELGLDDRHSGFEFIPSTYSTLVSQYQQSRVFDLMTIDGCLTIDGTLVMD